MFKKIKIPALESEKLLITYIVEHGLHKYKITDIESGLSVYELDLFHGLFNQPKGLLKIKSIDGYSITYKTGRGRTKTIDYSSLIKQVISR